MMVLASALFATMGVAVKLASAHYGPDEIVFYRGLTGAVLLWVWTRRRGVTLRTQVPMMHVWRSAVGVTSLVLWFHAFSLLPLSTAVTLNYMSSVWMAAFLIGGAVLVQGQRVDGRLIASVLAGFAGVVLMLRPSLDREQLRGALSGLASGMLAALAYLQVTALGRAGEPEDRVVFYFSLGGMAAGAALTTAFGQWHGHGWRGAALLLTVGVLATSAQLLLTRAYAVGRPLVNASLQYLGIVFSCVYGAWLFDDPLEPLTLAGMALIVSAGIAATLLRRRQLPQVPDDPASEH